MGEGALNLQRFAKLPGCWSLSKCALAATPDQIRRLSCRFGLIEIGLQAVL